MPALLFFPYISERETSSQYPVETERGGLKNYETASFLPSTKTSNTEENKKKSLLNTSYSSEEILLQAASSLQGLEGRLCISGIPGNFWELSGIFWELLGIIGNYRKL